MIYLLNFNITYIIIFATCLNSYEPSSGINFQEVLYILFYSFYVSQFFFRTVVIGIPFLHYKTRANVYIYISPGFVMQKKRDPYCNSSTKKL